MTAEPRVFDLPHLAARLFGAPLAVARPKLEVIVSAVGTRLLEGGPLPATAGPVQERAAIDVSSDGIATIEVIGSLVKRGGFRGYSGMSSYDAIGADVDAALNDPRVKGVILAIDSPGGEVAGLFDLVAKIEALAESKPVYAVADEEAYSAGYAIACAAECIYVARTGGVGSVGVVALHVDQSGADAKRGHSYTYIHGGAKKVDRHSHAPLSPRSHGELQAEVDRLHGIFAESVAQNRDMSVDDVMATEAGVFMGEQAVEAGLADQVGTLEDATRDLRAELDARRQSMKISQMLGLAPEANEAAQCTALEAKFAELSAAKSSVTLLQGEVGRLAPRVRELESALGTSVHDRAVERVDVLRERGASVDEHLAQEDRGDVIKALESGDEFSRRLGESLLSTYRARVEAAEKARGARGQTHQKPPAGGLKADVETEADKERMLRGAGFDVIVKDAHGRIVLDQCSSPEGRKKREGKTPV